MIPRDKFVINRTSNKEKCWPGEMVSSVLPSEASDAVTGSLRGTIGDVLEVVVKSLVCFRFPQPLIAGEGTAIILNNLAG
jgi:hypothetical protein